MTTIKQQETLEKIVENRGNIGKAMIEAGYSKNTAKNPQNLTLSKGYKNLLSQHGLTEELIIRSLVEDIRIKKGRRIAEMGLGAEILGMRKLGPYIANQITLQDEMTVSVNPSYDPQRLEKISTVVNDVLKNNPALLD